MIRKSFFLSIIILIFVLWVFPDQKSQDTTEKEQQKLEYKITVTANRIEKSTKKVAASWIRSRTVHRAKPPPSLSEGPILPIQK